jgi:hypothetical protein
MQTKHLNQIKFNVTHGSPGLRLKSAEEAIPVLRQELNRLREKAESQCREFATMLAAWSSTDVGEAIRPVIIEQDLREARMVNIIAVILAITELVLTFFISLVFAVSAPFLLLIAVVAIFALKVGLLALWRDQQQPQQTRRRLRRYVIAPSLVVTMLALAMIFFARTAGLFALLLLPLINLAICVLSIGCLGLAAGLFAMGFLMSWSRHAEKRFNAIEHEAVETRRVLQHVEKVAEELRASKQSKISGTPVSPGALPMPASRVTVSLTRREKNGSKGGSILPTLVLLIALCGGGCQISGSLARSSDQLIKPPQSTQQTPASSDAVFIEIWLDWSLSAEDQSYRETVKTLIGSLPVITARHRIAHISAYKFGNRGWNATEILSLDLPSPTAVKIEEVDEIFGQVRDEKEKQADQQYRSALREKFAAITPEALLPVNAIEPPCTDLQGVLNRIGATSQSQKRLVFLISDLNDTCSGSLQALSPAQANIALVAIVLPEEQGDAAQSPDQPRPDQLWIKRRDEFQKAVPGATVIPYFGDPGSAVAEALSKHGNQPKN